MIRNTFLANGYERSMANLLMRERRGAVDLVDQLRLVAEFDPIRPGRPAKTISLSLNVHSFIFCAVREKLKTVTTN